MTDFKKNLQAAYDEDIVPVFGFLARRPRLCLWVLMGEAVVAVFVLGWRLG